MLTLIEKSHKDFRVLPRLPHHNVLKFLFEGKFLVALGCKNNPYKSSDLVYYVFSLYVHLYAVLIVRSLGSKYLDTSIHENLSCNVYKD